MKTTKEKELTKMTTKFNGARSAATMAARELWRDLPVSMVDPEHGF
jgi:hypothetical protein